MLQEYKNLLIDINTFKSTYNEQLQKSHRLEQQCYRRVLDELFQKYDLFLLGDNVKETQKIAETSGVIAYFQKIYVPKSSTGFIREDFEHIMYDICYSDYQRYLVVGRDINKEISAAFGRLGFPTCLIADEDTLLRVPSDYKIESFEKIKTIV